MLCDAYIRAGRPDLADCVRHGQLYVELDYILLTPIPCDRPANRIVNRLNRLTRLFDLEEDRSRQLPAHLRDWGLWALDRYSDDTHLSSVIELDTSLFAMRRPAKKMLVEPNPYRRPEQYHYSYFANSNPKHGRTPS